MAVSYYKELLNQSRDHSDRYRSCKLLEDIETGETFLATREIVDIPPRADDMYHRVKSNESSRLDILANQYYKNPLLWWVIAQANGIVDPMNPITPGTIIRIPSIESLYGTNGILL